MKNRIGNWQLAIGNELNQKSKMFLWSNTALDDHVIGVQRRGSGVLQ
jgi:hypothetical protein